MDGNSDQKEEMTEPSAHPTTTQEQQEAYGQGQYQNQPQTPAQKPKAKKANKTIYAVIIILIVAAIAILAYRGIASNNNISSTTTIPSITSSLISSCGSITSPGVYSVAKNVTYSGFSGNCITINSDNVKLVCNNSISGSGPFAAGSNSTYGVYVENSSNVSVIGCHISKFSYGIGTFNSKDLNITNNNASHNVISNIYVSNTTYSNIQYNTFVGTTSENGSVYITEGSKNNTISDNNLTGNNRGVYVNSENNSYVNNNVSNTNVSFYCTLGSGVYGTSTAKSNTCSNDFGCSFLYCSANNILANVSNITLSSQINSCGSITSPGDYYLANSINATYVEPFGNVWVSSLPCISIRSSSVNLYCNNDSITNASTGISMDGIKNVNVTGCNINARNTGIIIKSSNDLTISNTAVTGADRGISIVNSSVDQFLRFKVYNNTIGIYVNGSFSNTFSGGYARNNSLIDIYASNDSLSPLNNLLLKTSCGVTDASWAACDHYLNASLKFFGLTSCTPLTLPGNYLLENNVLSEQQDCFPIKADNVTLNCNNNILTNEYTKAPGSSAVYASGKNNIEISNCTTSNFYTGINVSDSTNVAVYNNTLGGPQQQTGISLINVTAANVVNNTVTHGISDIYVSRVMHSEISNNTLSYSSMPGDAIHLENSIDNLVDYNNGMNNYAGIYLGGNSTNNTVSYNRMSLSAYADYICSGDNSDISAENGGINYGTKKVNCRWMAAISQGQVLQCASFLHPSTYTLAYDAVYGTGATCFSVYTNSSTIDCANHTIIATDGGTFASFIDASGTTLENCNLKGFTALANVKNSDTNVRNNTVYATQPSLNSTYVINVIDSSGPTISQNNITSQSGGIYLGGDTAGELSNNFVESLFVSYYIFNTSLMNIKNNIASRLSGSGWIFNNSTQNRVSGNSFYGQAYGVTCEGTSQNPESNTNSSNNYTSSKNCGWLG